MKVKGMVKAGHSVYSHQNQKPNKKSRNKKYRSSIKQKLNKTLRRN